MTTREDAALRRAAAVATRADRPSQRRSGDAAWSGQLARVSVPSRLELRSSESGSLVFEGWASAYESPYEMYDFFGPYTEVVSDGAGAKSLTRSDLEVPLVLAHDQLRRIARTTNGTLVLDEDGRGLHVLAPDLDPDDADVAYIAPKLRKGLIDEMSFAFRIVRGVWSPDYTEYRIEEFDLHRGDVAVVGFGANPATAAGLRSAAPEPVRTRELIEALVLR